MNSNGPMWLRITSFGDRVAASRSVSLEILEEPPVLAGLVRSQLWGVGGNAGDDLGEWGLQLGLFNPSNEDVLKRMAGVVKKAKRQFSAREVGDGGGMDVVALFDDDDKRVLLLLDCKRNEWSAGLASASKQYAQGVRVALGALSNLSFVPPPNTVKWILLRGWHPGIATEVLPSPGEDGIALPTWSHDPGCGAIGIPSPEWWGYCPLQHETKDEHYVVVGPWDSFGGIGKALGECMKQPKQPPFPVRSVFGDNPIVGGSEWSVDVTVGSDFTELSVYPRTKDYIDLFRNATGDATAFLKRLREIAKDALDDPWEYAGEENGKGCVRLFWRAKTKLADGYEEATRAVLEKVEAEFHC